MIGCFGSKKISLVKAKEKCILKTCSLENETLVFCAASTNRELKDGLEHTLDNGHVMWTFFKNIQNNWPIWQACIFLFIREK